MSNKLSKKSVNKKTLKKKDKSVQKRDIFIGGAWPYA